MKKLQDKINKVWNDPNLNFVLDYWFHPFNEIQQHTIRLIPDNILLKSRKNKIDKIKNVPMV